MGPSTLAKQQINPVQLQLNSSIRVSLPSVSKGKLFVRGLISLGPLSFKQDLLVDSGADANFIDSTLVAAWSVPLIPVTTPITLNLADGKPSSSGLITHQTVPVQLQLGNHFETITFLVTSVIHGMILGHPWLCLHNPVIDWSQDTVTFGSRFCLDSCTAVPSVISAPSSGKNLSVSWSPVVTIIEPDSVNTSVVQLDNPSVLAPVQVNASDVNSSMDTPIFDLASVQFRAVSAPVSPLPSTNTPYETYVKSYLSDYAEVFSKDRAASLPPHRVFDCDIPLHPNAKLPHGKVYQLTEPETDVLEKYITDNLASGLIRPSTSPASSPCFFVKKKDNSLRLCVDYRKLNDITVKNRYPLPLISDLIRSLHSAKHFSALDLRNGYHLIRIKEGDEHKTAFNTKFGLFEYLVMPFGLANAPSIFQAMMNNIFAEALNKFVVIYLDDILIFSNTPEEHDQHIRYVLDKLQQNNLFCKPEKCSFFQSSVAYLGFTISEEGVFMNADKITAITSWPAPTSLKDLQSFLGFTNFYRRFIKNYADIIKPLTKLLKKKTIFAWTEFQQTAFQHLKDQFQRSSILTIPDTTKPFEVETDASDFALGGVLSQRDDNNVLRPVAFYSRQFTDAELNYEIYDKELLAIHACFKEWRHFLQGARHQVIVYCDHKNLAYYKDPQQLTRRQARWTLFFAEFDFTIHHRPGVDNTKADLLSRRQDYADNVGQLPPTRLQLLRANPSAPDTFLATPLLETPQPEELTSVDLNLVDAGAPLATRDLHEQLKAATAEADIPQDCVLQHGLAYFGTRIYVPTEHLRLLVLLLRHDSATGGHFGIKKTKDLVARDFWWPGLSAFVTKYVKSCHCVRFKSTRKQPIGELQPLPVPTRPWSDISTDFIVGLPPCMGYNAISVWVCRLTKMAHFVPCSNTVTAQDTSNLFLHNVFRLHGLPSSIVSDRGPQFVSRFWDEFCNTLNIKVSLSTAYHPQTNGQSERTNQTLEQYLRCFMSLHQDNWVMLLPFAEFAYNQTLHTSIAMSPFRANYGFNPRCDDFSQVDLPLPPDLLTIKLADLFSELQHSMHTAQQNHKRYADKHRTPHEFAVGNMVWLATDNIRSDRPRKKYDYKFVGPFEILERIGSVAYKLDLPEHMHIHNVFHVSLLRPYIPNSFPDRPPSHPFPLVFDYIPGYA
jgi:transposase InsO family protein